jgi:alcohol dehydrogenase
VLRFNASHAAHLYADVASWIVVPYTHDGDTSSKTNALIDFLERILEEIGLPRTLKAVGVTRDDLPGLVNDAMKQQRLLINNPRAVSREDALAIYEAAF